MLLCVFVKTLVNGIQAQLKKERSRIIRQIDDAVNKAKFILLRRYVFCLVNHKSLKLIFSLCLNLFLKPILFFSPANLILDGVH